MMPAAEALSKQTGSGSGTAAGRYLTLKPVLNIRRI